MRITNTQKKELSDIFRERGLNLLDFETSGGYQEFKVKFKHDYFSFSIVKKNLDKFQLQVFSILKTDVSNIEASWEGTKRLFSDWVKKIDIELKTPTGWETFESENFLNAELNELEQEFSEIEKIKTRQNVSELRDKIKALELPEASLQVIDKKLDEIVSKVDSLNKFDWKSLFIGTIASLIMTLGIPPQASGMLWEYIKSAFSGLRLKG